MHLPQDLLNVIIVLSILVGFVQCFFGYRIFKLILGLTGFLFGGSLTCIVAYTISQEELVALLAGIIGGFIGAALMSAVFYRDISHRRIPRRSHGYSLVCRGEKQP